MKNEKQTNCTLLCVLGVLTLRRRRNKVLDAADTKKKKKKKKKKAKHAWNCISQQTNGTKRFFKPLRCQTQQLSSALSSFGYFKSHCYKQCGPRSDCSSRSSLICVHTVCLYAKSMYEKFARRCSRRHKQTTFSDVVFLGILRRVNEHIVSVWFNDYFIIRKKEILKNKKRKRTRSH